MLPPQHNPFAIWLVIECLNKLGLPEGLEPLLGDPIAFREILLILLYLYVL